MDVVRAIHGYPTEYPSTAVTGDKDMIYSFRSKYDQWTKLVRGAVSRRV
jgi:hypothetical protein